LKRKMKTHKYMNTLKKNLWEEEDIRKFKVSKINPLKKGVDATSTLFKINMKITNIENRCSYLIHKKI